MLLENILKKEMKNYTDIDCNLERNYYYLSTRNGEQSLKVLQKEKYKCIELSKKNRNFSLYTGGIAIIISIFLSIATAGLTLINSIYADTKERVNTVIEQEITAKENKLEKLQEDLNKANNVDEIAILTTSIDTLILQINSQKDTVSNIKEQVFTLGLDLKFSGWSILGGIVLIAIILGDLFYYLIKRFYDKAAEYETLVTMIDTRISEIKATNWNKAQKTEVKILQNDSPN